MVKQIGLYGGSFDPIHIGHLNLAIEMLEAHRLDEVWFCPTALNPLKQQKTAGNAHDRLNMIQLAIEGEPRFRRLDIEIHRPSPCYTIDTLHQLQATDAGKKTHAFHLIIGADAAYDFYHWHQPDEIIKCAKLLVGRRHGSLSGQPFAGSTAVVAALKQGLTPTRIMEISSSDVRSRLGKGLYCGHLVPGKVLDYIVAHHLYLTT